MIAAIKAMRIGTRRPWVPNDGPPKDKDVFLTYPRRRAVSKATDGAVSGKVNGLRSVMTFVVSS